MHPWKKCECCGREVAESQWPGLKLVGRVSDHEEELELRDCECRNTLVLVIRRSARLAEAA